MEHQLTPPVLQRGFTLIELLVVVAIISVLTVGATLTVGRSGGSETSDLTLFQKTHDRLRGMAISGQQIRGLRVEARGMFTAHYSATGWIESATRINWAGRVAVDVPFRHQSKAPGAPQLTYLPNGESTPFSIQFQNGTRCVNDGWAPLTCDG